MEISDEEMAMDIPEAAGPPYQLLPHLAGPTGVYQSQHLSSLLQLHAHHQAPNSYPLLPNAAARGRLGELAAHPPTPPPPLDPSSSSATAAPHIYDFVNSMELVNRLGNQWGGTSMSFQMQTQMLSRLQQNRQGKGQPYEEPFIPPLIPHPLPHRHRQPHLPPLMAEQIFAGVYPLFPTQQQQHHALLPLQDNLPGRNNRALGQELRPMGWGMESEVDPHDTTIASVLSALMQEMKSTMQRDLNRKMVEIIAFRAFDEWWERKEEKAKVRPMTSDPCHGAG